MIDNMKLSIFNTKILISLICFMIAVMINFFLLGQKKKSKEILIKILFVIVIILYFILPYEVVNIVNAGIYGFIIGLFLNVTKRKSFSNK